ncbi:MAG: hypothetical protein ACLFPJ_03375 [Candidatus Woesearchaeota archaeon]
MKDKHLLVASTTTAIIGIIVLFIIMQNSQIPTKNIALINDNDLDKQIRIEGSIKSIQNNEKITILKVETIQEIEVVIFDEIDIEKNSNVEVIGIINRYNKRYQINAESVKYI